MHARLSAYYFLHFAFIGVFAPYFGLYLHGIGLSPREIGILLSLTLAMRLFAPFLWGSLVDRGVTRHTAIRLTLLGSIAGLSVYTVGDGFARMLLATAIWAFCWNGNLPVVESLAFDYLRERAAQYGRIRMWGSLGFIVAVLGLGHLLDSLPTGSVVHACWLITLGMLALSLALPNPPRCQVPANSTEPGLSATLKTPAVAATLAAGFTMAAAHGSLNLFLSIHLAEQAYSRTAIGVLWSLAVVAEIAVFALMPRIERRFGTRTILLSCFSAAVVRFALIGWWVDRVPVAVFTQVLHALTFGAHHAVSISAINRWFTGASQARGQVLYASLYGAGSLVGSLASGHVWEETGSAWAYTASSAFSLVGLLLVVRFVRNEWLPKARS